jgi:hypothetical protein
MTARSAGARVFGGDPGEARLCPDSTIFFEFFVDAAVPLAMSTRVDW